MHTVGLDENDGLLIHSENFQALQLIGTTIIESR